MTSKILTASDLEIGYTARGAERRSVAKGLCLEARSGELICLLGPNGVGKSTLLHTLAGMLQPIAGEVRLGRELLHTLSRRELAKRVSVVLTHRVDAGRLSVTDLVALGRHPHTGWTGALTAADRGVIAWAIRATGSEDLACRHIAELSDGERQKVMIARALAQQPELMLLDEPTAFLDLARRASVMRLLRDLARKTGHTFLVTTHDVDLALRCADRIWLFPPGGPLRSGAPESLVLSGAFQDVFSSEGLHFDPHTGTFRLDAAHGGRLGVIGEGLHAYWTRRALEREGYEVSASAPHVGAAVEVDGADGRPRWRLSTGDTAGPWGTLEELMNTLRDEATPEGGLGVPGAGGPDASRTQAAR